MKGLPHDADAVGTDEETDEETKVGRDEGTEEETKVGRDEDTEEDTKVDADEDTGTTATLSIFTTAVVSATSKSNRRFQGLAVAVKSTVLSSNAPAPKSQASTVYTGA